MTIKNLAITVPTIGRISIGHIEERDGKRLPAKDDYFHITTQAKQYGEWIPHPLASSLAKSEEKLRAIPVRFMFNHPDLNFRYRYELFDTGTKRQRCVGDGERAKRLNPATGAIEEVECLGADRCDLGKSLGCRIFGRLYVQIEGQKNDLATFIHRTRGYNATKALRASIAGLAAGFPGRLAGLPLTLKLRGKASPLSYGSLFFYADLEPRDGLTLAEVAKQSDAHHKALAEVGFNREAFEQAYITGLQASPFEETAEEAPELEEFLLEGEGDDVQDQPCKKGVRVVAIKSRDEGGTGLERLRRGPADVPKSAEQAAVASA
jgi:hypothetical protein